LTVVSLTIDSPATPRWLHVWAIVTVLAALPPMFLGSEVTTKGAGMVDPDGFSHFREPWIFVRQWQEGSLLERGLAYVIEHGHRLAGIVVGLCATVLALGLLLQGRRPLLRWLGPLALLAVILQGLVGALRVHLNALVGPNLALMHGCTAALVLALLVSIAVLTSPGWTRPVVKFDAASSLRLRRLSLGVLALIYGQLILGAFVRHANTPLASRLHVLTAFLVVAGIIWLLKEWLSATLLARRASEDGVSSLACAACSCAAAAIVMVTLLGLQLFLGLEAFLSKFRVAEVLTTEPLAPLLDPHLVRSLHYLTGAALFSAALAVTMLIHRSSRPTVREVPASLRQVRELEGVA
jgi:cytochrome c oxidase assembly protein subunit 15